MNSIGSEKYAAKTTLERNTLRTQLDALSKELEQLESIAQGLNERLDPILQPMPVDGRVREQGTTPNNDCSVVSNLSSSISRVAAVTAHLHSLAEKLQL